jgi:hypothetical protein
MDLAQWDYETRLVQESVLKLKRKRPSFVQRSIR